VHQHAEMGQAGSYERDALEQKEELNCFAHRAATSSLITP
jgi:hypothetical protein